MNMRRMPAITNAVQVTKNIVAKQTPAIANAAATAMIGLKVDGRSVQVPKGATLLDAINKSGSHVPTLCYHPGKLSIPYISVVEIAIEFNTLMLPKHRYASIQSLSQKLYVSCPYLISVAETAIGFNPRLLLYPISGRMCLVDVKGAAKPLPACRTKAEEGQDIVTNSEEIKSFRRR